MYLILGLNKLKLVFLLLMSVGLYAYVNRFKNIILLVDSGYGESYGYGRSRSISSDRFGGLSGLEIEFRSKYSADFRKTWPICEAQHDTFLLYVINSRPGNARRRTLIRETWGNVTSSRGYGIKVVFVIGETFKIFENDLRKEEVRYADIVRAAFWDSYRNLTLKTMIGMEWAITACPRAQFYVKGDDDVVMFPQNMMAYISTLRGRNRDQYSGLLYDISNSLIERNRRSKWYISEKVWPHEYFGSYISGLAVLQSMDVTRKFYDSSLKTKTIYGVDPATFPVDDFYVGLLARDMGVPAKRNKHICGARVKVGGNSAEMCKLWSLLALTYKGITSKDMVEYWTSYTSFRQRDWNCTARFKSKTCDTF
jgi:hypothetical protein